MAHTVLDGGGTRARDRTDHDDPWVHRRSLPGTDRGWVRLLPQGRELQEGPDPDHHRRAHLHGARLHLRDLPVLPPVRRELASQTRNTEDTRFFYFLDSVYNLLAFSIHGCKMIATLYYCLCVRRC